MCEKSKSRWNLMKSGQKSVGIGWKEGAPGPDKRNESPEQALATRRWCRPAQQGLTHENRWKCCIRDVRHATSGPEYGAYSVKVFMSSHTTRQKQKMKVHAQMLKKNPQTEPAHTIHEPTHTIHN